MVFERAVERLFRTTLITCVTFKVFVMLINSLATLGHMFFGVSAKAVTLEGADATSLVGATPCVL